MRAKKDLILSFICLRSCISIITFHLENLIKAFFEAKDGYTYVGLLNIWYGRFIWPRSI